MIKEERTNTKYRSWVKAGLAFKYLKEGINDLVSDTCERQHAEIISGISSQRGSTISGCDKCSLDTLLPAHSRNKRGPCPYGKSKKCNCSLGTAGKMCPSKICSDMYDQILKSHRFSSPNWKNSNIHKWHVNHWEIAKCFINANGYMSVSTPEETDVSGLLCILLNNLEMQKVSNYTLADVKKIREFRNKLFHSPRMELDKHEFDDNIYCMTYFLEHFTQIKYIGDVQNAKQKLLMLSNESFVVTMRNEAEVYKAAIQSLEETATDKVCSDSSKMAYTKNGDEGVQTDYLKKKKDLQADLIAMYRQHHLQTSIQPSVLDGENDFGTWYVQPEMIAEYPHNEKGKSNVVKSFRDIFFTDGIQNKSIYIVGEAGIGKTTFCKRLINEWCNAHLDNQTSGKNDDENLIKDFNYLFYIPLRDAKGSCSVQSMIVDRISRWSDKKMLEQMLSTHSDKCLIVLDGLDEWTHDFSPQHSKSCLVQNGTIPNVSVSEEFTVLITTRPWKTEDIYLNYFESYMQVRMLGLSRESASVLTERIVSSLNAQFGQSRQPVEFLKETKSPTFLALQKVPLLLEYLLCLWYDGKYLRQGLCRNYIHIIEQMITRTREKPMPWKRSPTSTTLATDLPECFNMSVVCIDNKEMLMKLGAVAFDAMCNEHLVMNKRELYKYMTHEDIYWCFATGLLTENLNENRSHEIFSQNKYSFIHKSFQELFAALHLWTEKDFQKAKTQVQRCTKNQCVFGMDHFIVFLSGMNPFLVMYLLEELEHDNECNGLEHEEKIRDIRVACLKEIQAHGSYKK